MEKLDELYKKLNIMRKYSHALGIMSFDFETIAPENARENESETMDYFANELFKISNSDEMKELIVDLYAEKDKLSALDAILVDNLYENYLKTKNITPEFDLERNKVYSKAYIDWLSAKGNKDFTLFKDSLQAVIDTQKKEISLRENALPNLYDNLLNDFEPQILSDTLDNFFSELKDGLLSILGKIQASDHAIRGDFLTRYVPIHKQEKFSKYLLNLNGYDFKRGALTTTEHPFTSDIAKNDARVTTHYYENLFVSNIYSVIHEGGHAIFMQNEPDEDYEHFINDSITNGMHESVSRFYENVIGRSKEYIHLIYPEFIKQFGDEFGDVSEKELYEAVNIVKPSLIRTEADEVTYGLHIIIRYEMEKLMLSGKIKVEDAPKTWNKLYKEYLGVDVPDDSVGILQDVHWTGAFGYFPSYAIGNAYNAIYTKKMAESFDYKKAISDGNISLISDWLKENVFKNANRKKPKDWLYSITGETLSPKPFLEYLNNKYAEIYKF